MHREAILEIISRKFKALGRLVKSGSGVNRLREHQKAHGEAGDKEALGHCAVIKYETTFRTSHSTKPTFPLGSLLKARRSL